MPQYKRTQYGLKQYGTFIPTADIQGSGRWQFIRTRFGIRKAGKTFWLYQHTPATVKGKVTRLRLRTNTGDCLTEDRTVYRGRAEHVRLRTNTGETLTAQSMRN